MKFGKEVYWSFVCLFDSFSGFTIVNLKPAQIFTNIFIVHNKILPKNENVVQSKVYNSWKKHPGCRFYNCWNAGFEPSTPPTSHSISFWWVSEDKNYQKIRRKKHFPTFQKKNMAVFLPTSSVPRYCEISVPFSGEKRVVYFAYFPFESFKPLMLKVIYSTLIWHFLYD